MRRALMFLGVLLFLGIAGSRWLPSFLAQTPPCSQSCRDWTQCCPLELALSIKPIRGRAGTELRLWYKAEITNSSCLLLDFNAKPFMEEEASPYRRQFLLRLKAPRDVKPREFTPLPAKIGGVTLYRPDEQAQRALMRTGKLDEDWRARLRPGETISTVPDVLSPYRESLVDVRTEDGGRGTAPARASAPVPAGAEPAPAGYRALMIPSQMLAYPGTYELSIVARSLGAFGEPILPRWQTLERRLPVWLIRLLHEAGVAPRQPLVDGPGFVASSPVKIEVLP